MDRQGDLTEGAVWKKILLFALPLLGSSFIQQLYNTMDILFAGNLLGKQATAAIGASSLLITCLVGFFTGLSVGTSVIVSMAVGAGKTEKAQQAIHTAMGLSLAGGAVLSVAGILLAKTVLGWMDTPEEILDAALSYMRIYLLSMIPLVTYNMNAGILRALGNSRIPMLIQLAGGLINIVMDYVSIRFWLMGVEGVAWASMFSQSTAAILSIFYLRRGAGAYRLVWKEVRIAGNILKEIIRIGVPAGLQSLVITLSNIFIQYAINGFGVDAVAAFAAYFKVELLLYLPIVAFGQTMMTFAGQNTGAGNTGRVKKGIKACILMGAGYAVGAAFLLLLFDREIFGIFQRDADVITCGIRIMRVTFPFYWLYVILEVLADTLRGTGKSLQPMMIILGNICVFRTLLLAVFVNIWGSIEAVAAVYPAAWLSAAICFVGYCREKTA